MRPDHQRRAAPATKPAVYIVLIFLTYILGYFSASSFKRSNQPPTTTATTTTTTNHLVTAVTTDCGNWDRDHYLFTGICSSDPVPPELVRQVVIDRSFNGSSPYTDFPPAFAAPYLKDQSIIGWGSSNPVFENVIRRTRPKIIIEVGAFLGASTTHMARMANRLGLNPQIISIDDFRGWPGFRSGKFKDIPMKNGEFFVLYQYIQNVINMNFSESIIVLPFSSTAGLDNLCSWGVFAELIEVDAGHDFHSVWADMNRAYKLLKPGGIMFGHDYFYSADNFGVRRAVHLFARVNGLKVKVDGEHWILEPK